MTATQVVAQPADGRIAGNTSEFSVPHQVTGSGRNGGSPAFADVTTTSVSTRQLAIEFPAVGQGSATDQTVDLFSQPTDWMWFDETRPATVLRLRRRRLLPMKPDPGSFFCVQNNETRNTARPEIVFWLRSFGSGN